MKNLAVKTQNKKGNAPQYKENLGYITTFIRHSEDYIVVDDFVLRVYFSCGKTQNQVSD